MKGERNEQRKSVRIALWKSYGIASKGVGGCDGRADGLL